VEIDIAPPKEIPASPAVPQASNYPHTPPNRWEFRKFSKAASTHVKPIGNGILHDATGSEQQMDGTPKIPYRHPHFNQNLQGPAGHQMHKGDTNLIVQPMTPQHFQEVEGQGNENQFDNANRRLAVMQ
jgi:hypothetical protein